MWVSNNLQVKSECNILSNINNLFQAIPFLCAIHNAIVMGMKFWSLGQIKVFNVIGYEFCCHVSFYFVIYWLSNFHDRSLLDHLVEQLTQPLVVVILSRGFHAIRSGLIFWNLDWGIAAARGTLCFNCTPRSVTIRMPVCTFYCPLRMDRF